MKKNNLTANVFKYISLERLDIELNKLKFNAYRSMK